MPEKNQSRLLPVPELGLPCLGQSNRRTTCPPEGQKHTWQRLSRLPRENDPQVELFAFRELDTRYNQCHATWTRYSRTLVAYRRIRGL